MQIVRVALFFALVSGLSAQTGGLNIVGGVINFGAAPHTATIKIVANVPALPAAGCTVGELAMVTSATLGQQLYQNSGSGACVWTQQLNTGSSNGGGITVYSAPALAFTGTQYIPIGGGGLPSATETDSDTPSPSAATVTNFEAQLSAAPGLGISIAFTWRKNASSQSLTCTISGAVATSCSDTVDSFGVSQGDLLTIQTVTTGAIVGTRQLITAVQFGTTGSNGTVNSGTTGQVAYYAAGGTAVSGVGPGTTTTVLHGNAAGAPSYGSVVNADIGAAAVTSAKQSVEPTRRTACLIFGSNNGSALADADLGPQSRQYFLPYAATLVEMEVAGDAGTPNIILGRSRAGSIVNVVSAALATASSGGIACSNTGATLGLDGATTCSGTLQNTGWNVGDWITAVSGTAGGTAKEMTACLTFITTN
jgi:hypothetical protein